MTEAQPVVCLMGPTASGKTDLAAAIHDRLPVDIISVDSAMVYRGMDIGTAKPDAALLERVPHALIDVADPLEHYSAARFVTDAAAAIEKIHAAGRIPLLVGGTMLYFSALTRGLSPLPSADAAVRAELDAEARREGWPALHARLARSDPESAARIHPNDAQRIQRALEILHLTGRTPSHWYRQASRDAPRWRYLRCALWPSDRQQLHARMACRFDAMLAAGFLDEVAALRSRADLHPGLPAMRAVGYRQLWAYWDGELSLPAAVEKGVTATRQLAKRQLTWLRREQSVETVLVPDPKILSKVLNILTKAGLHDSCK